MKFTRCIVAVLLVAVAGLAMAQTTPSLQKKLKGAIVSYAVNDVATGILVADCQSNVAITPASITKVITTASALEMLGADYQFKTYLEYDGVLRDSILIGNLYVRGGGDPTLGSEFLGNSQFMTKWVEAVRSAGISQIKGGIVADASAYDNEGFNPRWTWLDVANYYASGIYGISVNDNMLRIFLKTDSVGSVPEVIKLVPNIPDFVLESHLKASKIEFDSAYLYGLPLSNVRMICGAIPSHRKSFVVRGDIPNPPLYLAQLFQNSLEENGILVENEATVVWAPSSPRKPIYTHSSPALKDIVRITNFYSNNHYAEHIFKQIAFAKTGIGSSATAQRLIKDFWLSKGFDVSCCSQYDGSGLSRENAFTVEFFNKVLVYMKSKSPYGKEFAASLPRAGKEGTVRNLLQNTELQEKVRVKSGSMSRVQCYSGYVDYGSRHYAFTVAVNNFPQSRSVVKKEIEKWLLDTVTQTK